MALIELLTRLFWSDMRFTLLISCIFFVMPAMAYQPLLSNSKLSNRLHQPTVSVIFKSGNGALWVGTQQGLHRFDGVNSIVFDSNVNNKNWIPDSSIKDLSEDIDGNLLALTSNGHILRLAKNTLTFDLVKTYESVGKSQPSGLFVSKNGDIWVYGWDLIATFDSALEFEKNLGLENALLQEIGRPHDMMEDEYGDIWIAADSGLAKIVSGSGTLKMFDSRTLGLPLDSKVTTIQKGPNDSIILGTDVGTLSIWSEELDIPMVKNLHLGNRKNYISGIQVFGDSLIIATDRGLYRAELNLSNIEDISDRGEGLSNQNIHSLLLDNGHLWIGTINGLDMLTLSPFDLFNERNSGISNDILTFAEDHKGKIWIGTYSGLYSYDFVSGKHIKYPLEQNDLGPNNLQVSTISVSNSHLWVGFLNDGLKLAQNTSTLRQPKNLSNFAGTSITKILADPNGSSAFVATYNQGLFRITENSVYSYYGDKSLNERSITTIFRLTSGSLIAVAENRIYLQRQATTQFDRMRFDYDVEKVTPTIYSFAEAENGDIFVGTKDFGLFVWRKSSQLIDRFLTEKVIDQGMTNATIYGIEIDAGGNLWCSTQNGIVKLDPQGKFIRRFTVADGLQGNDFNYGASFTSREGLIYFGGVNGYNRFDPMEIEIDDSASPMKLTGITLPGSVKTSANELSNITSLELTHKDRFLTFQFSVLDFIHPEKNQFRYTLENFDPEWIENGTRNTATYTNLSPGSYTFRAQGANSAGIWNREGIAIDVRVLPPPWLTWWAYCIYAAVLASCVWIFHRIYRSYAIERRSIQLAREMFEAENQAEDDMLEQLELQDELVESAYEHNRTTLALIEGYLQQKCRSGANTNSQELARSNVSRVTALKLLEDSFNYEPEGPLADLNAYTDRIIPMVLEASPVSSETIVTVNQVDAIPIPAPIASPLSIVILELIENCVLHAFKPESPANFVQIQLSAGYTRKPLARCLNLTVSDNGRGVVQSLEKLIKRNSGIALIQSLIAALGGELSYASDIGTTVSVTIPLPSQL